MTLTELCCELKRITLGECSDEPEEIAPIVNMSLARLYADLRKSSVYSFFKKEILPLAPPLSFHKKGGEDATLPLAGRAYGMHLAGCGEVVITVGKESESFEFDTPGEFFSGLISGEGEITFTGSLSYDVYSLSFYDEITSENLSDIPTGMPKRYRLRELIPDLAAPTRAPRDGHGEVIDGAEYIGGELFLPPDYEGIVVIEYLRAPRRVSALLPDADIDIDYGYEIPLLHLCAYFSLLESEERLAERHLDAYLASLADISTDDGEREESSGTQPSHAVEYLIEDGWA
jgi:hypothetical protein